MDLSYIHDDSPLSMLKCHEFLHPIFSMLIQLFQQQHRKYLHLSLNKEMLLESNCTLEVMKQLILRFVCRVDEFLQMLENSFYVMFLDLYKTEKKL